MQHRLEEVQRAVAVAVEAALAAVPPGDLTDAMRYASAGGKRVRAFLVLESARLFGVDDLSAMPVSEDSSTLVSSRGGERAALAVGLDRAAGPAASREQADREGVSPHPPCG